MDGFRFDQLAKNLVTRADRRRVLQGVSGVLAALLGTSLGGEVTAAKRDKQDKRRKQRARGERSTGGGKPQGRCEAGKTNCRGKCVNLQTDPEHCGTCATRCTGAGAICCAGTCVDSQTNLNNCGRCGTVCTTTEANATAACTDGRCGITCAAGFKECNGTCALETTCCGGCANGLACQAGTCTCTTFSCRCGCGSTTEGDICVAGFNYTCQNPCTASSQCGPGQVCLTGESVTRDCSRPVCADPNPCLA